MVILVTYDEPRYPSTRTDADSYAYRALIHMRDCEALSVQQLGSIRDELAAAFRDGEDQGVCRAIIVLSIARANATDPATRAALGACLRVLGAGDF